VNRSLPPRGRGDRSTDSSRAPRFARTVPGVRGLARRAAAVARRPRFGPCCATFSPRSLAGPGRGVTAKATEVAGCVS
jgi:hypothetical protein